jgi:hypothetical protein
MNTGMARNYLMNRDRAMTSARKCRQLRTTGVSVAVGAESYWTQMARAYNDAACRILHSTSVSFNSHTMPR